MISETRRPPCVCVYTIEVTGLQTKKNSSWDTTYLTGCSRTSLVLPGLSSFNADIITRLVNTTKHPLSPHVAPIPCCLSVRGHVMQNRLFEDCLRMVRKSYLPGDCVFPFGTCQEEILASLYSFGARKRLFIQCPFLMALSLFEYRIVCSCGKRYRNLDLSSASY